MFYAVVNKNTGELENDCSICSIGILAKYQDFEVWKELVLDEIHMIIELTQEEYDTFNSSVARNEHSNKVEYGVKLNHLKLKEKLMERPKIEIPVEAEGLGGKEIIAIEQKLEMIVIERLDKTDVQK